MFASREDDHDLEAIVATKDTLPWKLHDGPSRPDGPLSLGHVHTLAGKHTIAPDRLRRYSRDIELAFSKDFELTPPRPDPAARMKGRRHARDVLKHLSVATNALAKTRELLRDLHFKHPYAHVGSPNPALQHIEKFDAAIEAVDALQRFVSTWERNDAVVYLGISDMRVVRDQRREVVCWTAFNLWRELERPLTYTTDPLTSERSGNLFTFVRDVVACVTEPASRLSDAALMAELDAYKAFREANHPDRRQ